MSVKPIGSKVSKRVVKKAAKSKDTVKKCCSLKSKKLAMIESTDEDWLGKETDPATDEDPASQDDTDPIVSEGDTAEVDETKSVASNIPGEHPMNAFESCGY